MPTGGETGAKGKSGRIKEEQRPRVRGGRLVFDTKPTLYLYVRNVGPARPAVPATAAQVERWLKGLDAEAFKDRERAFSELEKQGPAVRDALRKALEGKPPAEARRRIGLLLAKLEGSAGRAPVDARRVGGGLTGSSVAPPQPKDRQGPPRLPDCPLPTCRGRTPRLGRRRLAY